MRLPTPRPMTLGLEKVRRRQEQRVDVRAQEKKGWKMEGKGGIYRRGKTSPAQGHSLCAFVPHGLEENEHWLTPWYKGCANGKGGISNFITRKLCQGLSTIT